MRAVLRIAFWYVFTHVTVVEASEPLHRIPIELYGEKIFFESTIYDSIQVNVLFDNGISAYMHSGTAQKLGIEYTGRSSMTGLGGQKSLYTIDTLRVNFGGGYTHTFLEVLSQPAPNYLNRRVDFVFGREWIQNYVVYIDYTHKVMELYDPTGFRAPPEFDSLKVISWGNYPMIKSGFTFSGDRTDTLNMELNVGSEVGFNIDEFITRKYRLDKTEQNKGRIMIVGPDGRGVYGMICRIPEVQIGPFRHPNAKGGVFDESFGVGDSEKVHGQIGQPILKFYNIIFSYPTQQIWLIEKPEPE